MVRRCRHPWAGGVTERLSRWFIAVTSSALVSRLERTARVSLGALLGWDCVEEVF